MPNEIKLDDHKLPRIVHNLICGECGTALTPVSGDYGVLYDHGKPFMGNTFCPLEGHLFGLRDDLTVYKVK